MKLSENLLKELNKQYILEIESAFIYRHMAIWANANDFPGLKSWMEHQYSEEMEHAEKLYNYINERNADVVLKNISKPEGEYSSTLEVMKAALKHEEFVSSRFTKLSHIAREDDDYPSLAFLDLFHKEQVEEEANATYWVKRLEKCGDNIGALMIVDGEMGRRQG